MLLAQGKIIYYNEARLAVDHFASVGFPCPELSNPADFFMHMMSIESEEIDDADEFGESDKRTQE